MAAFAIPIQRKGLKYLQASPVYTLGLRATIASDGS